MKKEFDGTYSHISNSRLAIDKKKYFSNQSEDFNFGCNYEYWRRYDGAKYFLHNLSSLRHNPGLQQAWRPQIYAQIKGESISSKMLNSFYTSKEFNKTVQQIRRNVFKRKKLKKIKLHSVINC